MVVVISGKVRFFPMENCYTKRERESIEREEWIEKLHILIHATLNCKKNSGLLASLPL